MRILNIAAALLVAAMMVAPVSAAQETSQRTVLVTGANRGIGLEFVRQYAGKGYRVIAACRNPADAEALNGLAKNNPSILVEQLDLEDLAGIDALAGKYAGQPIDVVINNAALMRGPDKGQSFGSIDYAMFDEFFHTNVRGPLKVAEAFWPHAKASGEKMVVLLTTGQGARGIPVPGFAYYKSSKAAIDNLYMDIGRHGKKDGVRVLTLIPGRVATHGERQTPGMVPLEESVRGMIAVMEGATLEQNGRSYLWNGEESLGLPRP
jgi:NAD(P)-dependent dehydrogenase (short-subunit alcohol dehydrogenase family)